METTMDYNKLMIEAAGIEKRNIRGNSINKYWHECKKLCRYFCFTGENY